MILALGLTFIAGVLYGALPAITLGSLAARFRGARTFDEMMRVMQRALAEHRPPLAHLASLPVEVRELLVAALWPLWLPVAAYAIRESAGSAEPWATPIMPGDDPKNAAPYREIKAHLATTAEVARVLGEDTLDVWSTIGDGVNDFDGAYAIRSLLLHWHVPGRAFAADHVARLERLAAQTITLAAVPDVPSAELVGLSLLSIAETREIGLNFLRDLAVLIEQGMIGAYEDA